MSHFSCAVILPTTMWMVDGDEAVRRALLPYMENFCEKPPREYMEFFEDDDFDFDEETGRCGYWQNPNARWDWYVIGGRWGGQLRLKGGGVGNVAKVSDVVADGLRTHAVVTPDGKWHEVGRMGWFGVSSETDEEADDWIRRFAERFIAPYPDYTIVIVDCHI